jgi:hypothetical protein
MTPREMRLLIGRSAPPMPRLAAWTQTGGSCDVRSPLVVVGSRARGCGHHHQGQDGVNAAPSLEWDG